MQMPAYLVASIINTNNYIKMYVHYSEYEYGVHQLALFVVFDLGNTILMFLKIRIYMNTFSYTYLIMYNVVDSEYILKRMIKIKKNLIQIIKSYLA